MKTERALWLLMSIALAACADTRNKVEAETETHFLQSCQSDCGDGLSCICGVCTTHCSGQAQCADLSASASCASTPSSCGHIATMTCDVTCDDDDGCVSFGAAFTCEAGRCRIASGGAAGEGGQGGAGIGGQTSGGTGGDEPDSGEDGGPNDGGPSDGGPVEAGVDGSIDSSCDEIGDTCCPGATQDAPGYCTGAMIECGPVNQCQSTCSCNLPAFFPVCGVDGKDYNAACSPECMPVEIACEQECPCDAYCTIGCTDALPTQEVSDACAAHNDSFSCTNDEIVDFPIGCRWVTPSTSACAGTP